MTWSRGVDLVRIAVHLLVLRPLLWISCGVHVTGRNRLRHLDRFVLIANHNSHIDTLLLFHLLPWRQIPKTHPVAEHAYFSRSRLVLSLVSFLFRPVWIERGRPDLDPLGGIRRQLDHDHNIMVFPEGTRGAPGELLRFKSGIGRLAADYPDLPIIPVFLAGPERILPKRSLLPLPFFNHVVVGPPQICRGSHRDRTLALESILLELSESECAGRHRRRQHLVDLETRIPTIAVLGIDGSGKSTLSRALAERLSEAGRCGLVTDRLEFLEKGALLEVQPLVTETLRQLIGRHAKQAKSLKNYKIPKLAELLLRDHLLGEIGRWYRPDRVVMDGSPLLNMVAWAVLYREHLFNEDTCRKAVSFFTSREQVATNDPVFREFPELKVLKRLRLNRLSLPDAVVFLDVRPQTACRRIASRGEQRQVHETEDKLRKLRDAYLLVCDVVRTYRGISVLRTDGERPPDKVADEAIQFVESCRKERVEENGTAH